MFTLKKKLGTCGSPNTKVGTVVVADHSVLVHRNPNAFRKNAPSKPEALNNCYTVSEPVYAHDELTKLVR